MNNWIWDNPRGFGDEADRSNPHTTSSEMVPHTGECFSSYGNDDLTVMIEPPSCWQYKPGDSLAVRPLNWNSIIDEDEDDENREDPATPSCRRSRQGDGNDNHNGEGEENTQGGEKGTGKGKRRKDMQGTGKGKGKGNGKGKGIVK
jgi:hypothetical protein